MKFKVGKVAEERTEIVYLLEIHMEDKVLVKIGITSRSVGERAAEILLSAFGPYREFFYCRPKRYRKTTDMLGKEAMLHKYFEDRRYKTKFAFGGSTEIFDIPLDEAVEVYERVLDGEDVNESR